MLLYFIRHPQTQYNLRNIIQGHDDSSLTESGIILAKKLGDNLKNRGIQKIYSSDLGRCVQTVQLISGDSTYDVIFTDQLRERNFGDYNGKSKDEIRKIFDLNDINIIPSNGESFLQMKFRVVKYIQHIDIMNSGNVLIVGHEGTLRSVISNYYECDPNDSRCNSRSNCIYKFMYDPTILKFQELEIFTL